MALIQTNLPLYHPYGLQGFYQNKPPSITPLYTTRLLSKQTSSIAPLYATRFQLEQTSLYSPLIYYKASIKTDLPL